MDNKVIIPIYISTPKYCFLSPYQYLNLNIKNSFAHILLKDLIFFSYLSMNMQIISFSLNKKFKIYIFQICNWIKA